MGFPAVVEPRDGQFAASLVGAPEVGVLAATRSEALTALRTELAQRIERGQLASVEVPAKGILDLAGKYADDPTLEDICNEAYADRDRDRDTLDEQTE